jgi:hypothetical protein
MMPGELGGTPPDPLAAPLRARNTPENGCSESLDPRLARTPPRDRVVRNLSRSFPSRKRWGTRSRYAPAYTLGLTGSGVFSRTSGVEFRTGESARQGFVVGWSQGDMPPGDETPTDRYFPAKHPRADMEAKDPIARGLAAAAIALAIGLYMLNYFHEVSKVERERTACLRMERDVRTELRAWEILAVQLGREEMVEQAARLERVLRRDCDNRYPDPELL